MRDPCHSSPDHRIADVVSADRARARLLATEIAAAGHAPPVLIVADTAAITLLAPWWAESFAESGWPHRVLAFGGFSDDQEIRTIVAEARSSSALVLVGAGHVRLIDVVRRAAAAAGLPCVPCPATSISKGAVGRDTG